jgi:carboxypeptidase T
MKHFTFLTLALLLALGASVPAFAQTSGAAVASYRISNVTNVETRSAIAATGAAIFEVGPDYVLIEATGREARALKRLGLELVRFDMPGPLLKIFPPADSNYHDYAEMVGELDQAAFDHPAILSLFSLGLTYEGRTMWAVKISDNVGMDEDEPEVLLNHHQHAREHLTVEMALCTLNMLTDEYGVDPQITSLVDNREIWLVFDANSDGGEFDIATGSYVSWRKNRQPTPGSSYIGTDLNRKGLPLGLLRRQQRHAEQLDLPRTGRVLGSRDHAAP